MFQRKTMNYAILVFQVRSGGVRRYQNPDGTLTAAGKKRRALLDKAYKAAYKRSELNYKDALDFRDNAKRTRDSANSKSDQEEWLDEQYGNDWKNKKYMHDTFGIDDVHKHAKDEILQTAEYLDFVGIESARLGKLWLNRSKALKIMKVTDVDKDTLRLAKQLVEQHTR